MYNSGIIRFPDLSDQCFHIGLFIIELTDGIFRRCFIRRCRIVIFQQFRQIHGQILPIQSPFGQLNISPVQCIFESLLDFKEIILFHLTPGTYIQPIGTSLEKTRNHE